MQGREPPIKDVNSSQFSERCTVSNRTIDLLWRAAQGIAQPGSLISTLQAGTSGWRRLFTQLGKPATGGSRGRTHATG